MSVESNNNSSPPENEVPSEPEQPSDTSSMPNDRTNTNILDMSLKKYFEEMATQYGRGFSGINRTIRATVGVRILLCLKWSRQWRRYVGWCQGCSDGHISDFKPQRSTCLRRFNPHWSVIFDVRDENYFLVYCILESCALFSVPFRSCSFRFVSFICLYTTSLKMLSVTGYTVGVVLLFITQYYTTENIAKLVVIALILFALGKYAKWAVVH